MSTSVTELENQIIYLEKQIKGTQLTCDHSNSVKTHQEFYCDLEYRQVRQWLNTCGTCKKRWPTAFEEKV